MMGLFTHRQSQNPYQTEVIPGNQQPAPQEEQQLPSSEQQVPSREEQQRRETQAVINSMSQETRDQVISNKHKWKDSNRGLIFNRIDVTAVAMHALDGHLYSIPKYPERERWFEAYDNRTPIYNYPHDVFYHREDQCLVNLVCYTQPDCLLAIKLLLYSSNDNQFGFDTESAAYSSEWQKEDPRRCMRVLNQLPSNKQVQKVRTWQVSSEFFCAIFDLDAIQQFHPTVLEFFRDERHFFYGWNVGGNDDEVFGWNVRTEIFNNNLGTTARIDKATMQEFGLAFMEIVSLKKIDIISKFGVHIVNYLKKFMLKANGGYHNLAQFCREHRAIFDAFIEYAASDVYRLLSIIKCMCHLKDFVPHDQFTRENVIKYFQLPSQDKQQQIIRRLSPRFLHIDQIRDEEKFDPYYTSRGRLQQIAGYNQRLQKTMYVSKEGLYLEGQGFKPPQVDYGLVSDYIQLPS